MIPLMYFSPFDLVAASQKQPAPPIKHHRSTKTGSIHLYCLGLLVSATLHSMGLLLPPAKTFIEPVDTPPKPIMVRLSKPASTLEQSKPKPAKPVPLKKTHTKVKPPKPSKPRALPKIKKMPPLTKSVITTTGASKHTVAEPMPEAVLEKRPEPSAAKPTATPVSQTHVPVAKATEPPKIDAPLTLPTLNANYLHNPPQTIPTVQNNWVKKVRCWSGYL